MRPLYRDPGFTFRFADDRLIGRFHLEGVPAGLEVRVFSVDSASGERRTLVASATTGEGGWVDFAEALRVKAGDVLLAVVEQGTER